MLKILFVFLTLTFNPSSAHAKNADAIAIKTDLATDESWRIFPSFATSDSDGNTRAKIRAWVYEEESRSLVRRSATALLRNLLGLSDLILDENIFAARARYFLVDNERNKSVSVFYGSEKLGTGVTDENGQTEIDITWKSEYFTQLKKPIWIKTQTSPKSAHNNADESGLIQMIPEKGLSVISDIDDTIKVSGVLNKDELIERTFGKPFEDVEGMAKLYKQLEKNNDATFHYVSSSPWQLLPELQLFLSEKHFPLGSFHLKSFRLKDRSALALFDDPIAYKTAIIESLLKSSPNRKFYLFGDSGEKDPEIYADIAKRFPEQISGIFIRLVPTHTVHDTRFSKTFAGISQTMLQLFTSADEVKL